MGKLLLNDREYTGGASELDELEDVSITSATNGQILKYDGSGWVNANESTGSTVSVTQVQSTGTKIATITVDSVGTDLYAPNGGGGASALNDLSDVTITSATNGQVLKYNGSGWVNANESGGGSGHTILDNEGDSLTQRTNLQFKGAYSEDNSTDDTTEVNIVREMTKAEFDLLSADEKVGFINITDITGGNDDRFQPVIYSGEEREIGVWTNGKPLYAITLPYDTTSSSTCDVNTSTLSIEHLISYNFSATGNTYYYSGSDFIRGYFTDATCATFRVVSGSSYPRCAGYVTLRYIKTTDTAGSGQWTPQGVPAVHYDSTEHIIGTWVDGSTIYEQTVLSTTYIGSSATVIYNTTSIGWNKLIDISAIMDIYIPDEVDDIFASLKGPADLYVGLNRQVYAKQALATYKSGRTMETYITLRYTKSSS